MGPTRRAHRSVGAGASAWLRWECRSARAGPRCGREGRRAGWAAVAHAGREEGVGPRERGERGAGLRRRKKILFFL